MKLHSIKLDGRYKGLNDQLFSFDRAEANIIAFIGLNGSGKSQLLELIGETFAYIERWKREDFVVKNPLGFGVTIHYQWNVITDTNLLELHDYFFDNNGCSELKVTISQGGDVELSIFRNDGWCSLQDERRIPIPLIVGYASGLNENLQRGFMKNSVQYFEIMRQRMKRTRELNGVVGVGPRADINRRYLTKYPHIFRLREPQAGYADYFFPEHEIIEADTKASLLTFIDYDSFPLLVLSLSILSRIQRENLLQQIPYKHPAKAVIQFDLRNGVFEEDTVRDIRMLLRIAGDGGFLPRGKRTTEVQYDLYELDYLQGTITLNLQDNSVAERLQESNYNDPLQLFNRLNKIQLLGVKNWSPLSRNALLRDDFVGTVKKPLKSKLPLSVVELVLANDQGQHVNIDDLSDGEAQLVQILASINIFSKEQALFLFDEPETHLNPAWRTYFHSHLARALESLDDEQADSQIFLSTHSPFMISSLKRENVFFFERNEVGQISMGPVASQTYGASFDVLIKEHYGLRSLISQTVVDAVKEQLPNNNTPESNARALHWVEENLGESMEKAYLLRKLQN
jgi:predicted ATPase